MNWLDARAVGLRDYRLMLRHPMKLRSNESRASCWLTARLALLSVVALGFLLAGFGDAAQPDTVRIAAVGDVNGYNILGPGHAQADPLSGVRSVLSDHDIFIQNFEGAIILNQSLVAACPKKPRDSTFFSLPAIAEFLHPSKISIATLANNHILDCGVAGIRLTISSLAEQGIVTVGAGADSAAACQPKFLEVNGMRLAVVAYLEMEPASYAAGSGVPGAATWEECKAEKQIGDLAASGYFVVAALHLHLGYSWSDRTEPAHLSAVKRAMAAGADLVIATGPHIPQGILTDQNRVALLCLGDFLFHTDYKLHHRPERSVVAEVTISRSQIEVALVPLKREENGRPVRPTAPDAADTLARIAKRSAELGSVIAIRNGVGYASVPRRR